MPDTLSFAVYGRNRLDDESSWLSLFESLEQDAPWLVPRRWGEAEPLRQKWAGASATASRAAGRGSFRGETDSGGTIHILKRQTPFDLHTWFQVDVPFDEAQSEAAIALFKSIASIMDANYGHLHLLHPQAWGDTHLRYARIYDGEARLSVPPWVLELYLPNIYWGTVLGPDYITLFGAQVIASAPCKVVDPFDEDRFYLQATAALTDCRETGDGYVGVARAVMDHLGRDAFVDPAHYQRRGRAPDFSYLRDEEPPRPYKPLAP
jgi:hypothetical protein